MSWRRAWRVSSAVAIALVVVLAVTGVQLWSSYVPNRELLARDVHAMAARLLSPVVLAVAVTGVGSVLSRQARRTGWLAVVVPVVAVVAGASGFLIAWDQLALWAVTVGTDIEGMGPLFDDDTVRFVLVGDVEVSAATARRWAVVHVLTGVGVVAPLLLGLLRRSEPVSQLRHSSSTSR